MKMNFLYTALCAVTFLGSLGSEAYDIPEGQGDEWEPYISYLAERGKSVDHFLDAATGEAMALCIAQKTKQNAQEILSNYYSKWQDAVILTPDVDLETNCAAAQEQGTAFVVKIDCMNHIWLDEVRRELVKRRVKYTEAHLFVTFAERELIEYGVTSAFRFAQYVMPSLKEFTFFTNCLTESKLGAKRARRLREDLEEKFGSECPLTFQSSLARI